jgi:LysM repeat protein
MMKKYSLAAFMILMIMLSACQLQYPQGKQAAVTPSPTRRFASTLPVNDMSMVENLATGTALALTAGAGGNPNVSPTASPVGGTAITPITQITFTPTPVVVGAVTATPMTVVTSTPYTPLPQGARPATYTLQTGEFVYCIARRFDVDPDTILAINGLVDSETVYPGTVLKIPQSGSFPGDRALRAHPATYTVTSSSETLYSIACLFGDVDPAAIAQRNNISLSTKLSVGQVLNIP